jgi:hypothetical protein
MALLDFLFGGPSYSTLPNSPESPMQGASPNVLQRFGAGLDRISTIPGLPTPAMDEEERMRQRWMTLANIGSSLARGGTAAEGLQQARQQALQQQILGAQFQQMQRNQQQEQAFRQAIQGPTQAQKFAAGQQALAQGGGPTQAAAAAQESAMAQQPFANLTKEQRALIASMPYEKGVEYAAKLAEEEFGSPQSGIIGGQPSTYVVSKRGNIRVLDVKPTPDQTQVDTGAEILIMDKGTGTIVQRIPKAIGPADLKRLGFEEERIGLEKQRVGLERAGLGLRQQEFNRGNYQIKETDQGLQYVPVTPGGAALPVTTPTGEVVKGGGTKPTEGQLNAAGYASRMIEAESIIGQAPSQAQRAGTIATAVGAIPLVGGVAERSLMTPAQQQVRQAQEDWVRSKLRKESGAVIGDEEMAREIKTYFPQIGDSPEVIAQKSRSRQIAINAMKTSAGNAMSQVQAVPPQAPPSSGKRYKWENGRLVEY